MSERSTSCEALILFRRTIRGDSLCLFWSNLGVDLPGYSKQKVKIVLAH